jgi:hypothetical protein
VPAAIELLIMFNTVNIRLCPQALQDYDQAQARNFNDTVALLISRGMTKRVVKDFRSALKDLFLALDHMDKDDKVSHYCVPLSAS